MKNDFLNRIHAHGSVRNYKGDPVDNKIIETIIAAAQRTSTSSNLQAYSVIAVTDEKKRARLAELCGGQKHITEAPVFLTWCADLARLGRVCNLQGYTQETGYIENFLVAAIDAVIAAQTAALAAEALGLGICYIGSIRNEPSAVIKMLSLPRWVFPITGMTVGYPAREPTIRPRLPIEAILHWQQYNPDQDKALQEYNQAMIASGIYQGRQVSLPGKAGEEDYGWLEHSARRVSRPVRTGLLSALKDQGFKMA